MALTDELIAPSFLSHDPIGPDVHGPDGVKQCIAMYRNAFPDLQYTVEEIVTENDIVVWRWTAHGTHLGDLTECHPEGALSPLIYQS